MEIDNGLLTICRETIGLLENEIVLCCTSVTRVDQIRGSWAATLVATEFSFFLLEKRNSEAKHRSISGNFFWKDLTEVALVDDLTVRFVGSGEAYQIQHDALQYFLKIILNHISNILTPDELPRFVGLDKILEGVSRERGAFMKRFRFSLRIADRPLPDDFLSFLAKKLRNATELDIPSLKGSEKYTDILLECLQVEPWITSAIIPRGGRTQNCWTSLADCLRRNTTLIHVRTNGLATRDIARVAEALRDNAAHTKLRKFTFASTAMTNDTAPLIAELLKAVPFEELTFENSCPSNVFMSFVGREDVSFGLASVQSLVLVQLRNIDFGVIFKAMPALTDISIIDCRIAVPDLFRIVGEASNAFAAIKVTGGSLDGPIEGPLPSSLSEIQLNRITSKGLHFLTAWTTFMSHKPLNQCLSVGFNGLSLESNVWPNFFNAIGGMACPSLVQFSWDENPIDHSLLTCLMRSPKLTRLDANGCLSRSSERLRDEFVDFVNAHTAISYLSIRGTPKQKLGSLAVPILNKLKKNKSVRVLDVSNNDFQDAGLAALGELLLANKGLDSVKFESNYIATGGAYVEFFKHVMNRGPKLCLEWPEADFDRLSAANQLTSDAINQISDCFAIILNGNVHLRAEDDDDFFSTLGDNAFAHLDDARPIPEPASLRPQEQVQVAPVHTPPDDSAKWELRLPEIPIPDLNKRMEGLARTYTTEALYARLRLI
jgi:hypothetical protein